MIMMDSIAVQQFFYPQGTSPISACSKKAFLIFAFYSGLGLEKREREREREGGGGAGADGEMVLFRLQT